MHTDEEEKKLASITDQISLPSARWVQLSRHTSQGTARQEGWQQPASTLPPSLSDRPSICVDSTLWLPTAYAHIAKLTSNSSQTSYYFSIAQLLPAAVQMLVSLIIGPLAGVAGSLKWPAIPCSFAQLWATSSTHVLPRWHSSVWAIVGARCLVGAASGSGSLAMAYLTVSTEASERLEACLTTAQQVVSRWSSTRP